MSPSHETTSRVFLLYDPETGRILQRVHEITYGNGKVSSEAELRNVAEMLIAAKGLDASRLPSLLITDPQLRPRRYRVDIATRSLVADET
jgi:hypothetical protein